MANITLSKQIEYLRSSRGISPEWLAAELNVTTEDVQRWESGEAEPDLAMLCDIAKFLKVSVDCLLTGTGYDESVAGLCSHLIEMCVYARRMGIFAVDGYLAEMKGYEGLKIGYSLCSECCWDERNIMTVLRYAISDSRMRTITAIGVKSVANGCTPATLVKNISDNLADEDVAELKEKYPNYFEE